MRFPLRFFFLTVFALCPLVGFAVWALKRRLPTRPFRCLYALAVIIIVLDFYPYHHTFAWQHDASETRQLYEQLGQGKQEYRILSLSPDMLVDLGIIYSRKPAAWLGLVWTSPRLTHTFYVKSFEPVFGKEGSRNAATLFGMANLKYLVTDRFTDESLEGHLRQAKGLEPVAETSFLSAFVNTAWRPSYIQIYPQGALYVSDSASTLFSFLPYLSREGIAVINGPSKYLEDYPLDSLAEFDIILLDKPRSRDAERFEQLRRLVEGRLIQLEGLEPEEISELVSDLGSEEVEPVVEWHRPDPEEIRVNIGTAKPSVMMISETWYPHWHVYVDGKEKELLRVNYAFQGVKLDQGKHQVVFKYQQPFYFRLGYGLTALTLIAVGLALALEVWPLRRR